MNQRIAPNNQLPATHFIEVWKSNNVTIQDKTPFVLDFFNKMVDYSTIAIFRIRENKLPTKHKF